MPLAQLFNAYGPVLWLVNFALAGTGLYFSCGRARAAELDRIFALWQTVRERDRQLREATIHEATYLHEIEALRAALDFEMQRDPVWVATEARTQYRREAAIEAWSSALPEPAAMTQLTASRERLAFRAANPA